MLEFKRKEKPDFNSLEWIIPFDEFPQNKLTEAEILDIGYFLKWTFDFGFSLLVSLVALPFFLLIGLIIKLDSKGPMIFKQERVGANGELFKIYKFRTMEDNSDRLKKNLMKFNQASGPVFKMVNDPRITRVGKFLRKTGLDELPQFWNVLRGNMSLIGPRPPLEREVREYEEWQMRRLSVKPGITCTWQIEPDRNSIDWETWVQMDLDYIDNWNLLTDMKIFFGTIKSVVVAGGH